MTKHESGIGTDCPIAPLGNGKMLAYLAGVTLSSLHCGYGTPSFLSLAPELSGGYYESTSERLQSGLAVRHRMWFTPELLRLHSEAPADLTCDLLVTDRMAEGGSILLRTVEGKLPLCFRIQLPTYVRGETVNGYSLIHTQADALFCTVPEGTPFEHGRVLYAEKSLTVYLCGGLHLEADGRTIAFEGGRGHILFIDSTDPFESLQRADSLLASLQAGIDPAELDGFDSAKEAPRHEAANVADSERPLRAILEEAAASLVAMQAEEGYILGDTWHSYSAVIDLPLLTEALLRLGRPKDAERMLDYWAERIDLTSEHGDGVSSASLLLASLLLAENEAQSVDAEAAERHYRKMRKLFTHLMQALSNEMLPFLGDEACFEAGLISRDCLFHGSAVSTAIALAAAERYLGYCERNGYRIARESEHYLELIAAVRSSFERHFGGKRLYRLNDPSLEQRLHRPRFMRGICAGCSADSAFDKTVLLELDCSGHYRCKRCLSRARFAEADAHPRPAVESIDATAAVALWMPSPFRESALERAAAFYQASFQEGRALPLRHAACDAMLYAAAKACNSKHTALFRRALFECATPHDLDGIESSALPSAFVLGSEMKGAMCSSAAIAALIVALT